MKPPEKVMEHPYFGRIPLYNNGIYDKYTLESIQTAAFYYELVKFADSAVVYNGPGFSKEQFSSTLSTRHRAMQAGDVMSLSLDERFMHESKAYFSEITINGFKAKFGYEELKVNYDSVPVVRKDDRAYVLLKQAGRRVMNKPLDALLREIQGLWRQQKSDLHLG